MGIAKPETTQVLQVLIHFNPWQPNPGQSEKISLEFYFNTAFRNELVFKG